MIYFIQVGECGPIKIGYAKTDKNVRRRLHNINVDNHDSVRLIGQTVGTVADEARFHLQFSAHNIKGEWFRPAPELLALAARHAVAPRPKWRRTVSLPPDASLVRRVIFTFGTCTDLAIAMKVGPGVVHGWWRANRIPHWRVNEIIRVAAIKAVSLPEEFIAAHGVRDAA